MHHTIEIWYTPDMKTKQSSKRLAVLLIVLGAILGALAYWYAMRSSGLDDTVPSTVIEQYSVDLEESEKRQIAAGVDDYMNTYRLPKGIATEYTMRVEQRIGDAIRVMTNPDELDDFTAILYFRKVDGVWQLDEGAGPWCTLEEFERYDCE